MKELQIESGLSLSDALNDPTAGGLPQLPLWEATAAAAIIAGSDDAIITKSLDSRVLSWGGGAERIFGYTAREMVGAPIRRLIPKDRLHEENDLITLLAAGNQITRFETQRISKSGSIIDVSITLSPVRNAHGKIVAICNIARDVTEQNRLSQALRASEALMRVTLDSIADAVITTDVNGTVRWLNPVAARLTGWLLDEARGKSIEQIFNIIHEETRQPALSPVARALKEGRVVGLQGQTALISRDGTEFAIEDSAAPIRDADGKTLGVVLVFHNVTEQRFLLREINFRVIHDELTGLINRSEFEVRLKRVLANARDEGHVHALMYIDLDQFKLVNDAVGHAAGDDLLKQVSAILQNLVRGRDTIARLGGDEFGIILEHCSPAQARRVAEQVCDQIGQFRFLHDGRRFRIGASIGLVPLDARWSTTAALMQAADTSCYAAKDEGRNRVHEWFDTDALMSARHGEMDWATRLEEALDEKRFLLYGQRIARCRPGPPGLHAEVLLRLKAPDGAIIAPGTFLPAAERFHMASRIDRWVLREVLEQLAGGTHEDVETVCINLSGQSIGDRSFHRFAADLISQVPFDPGKLCFEITETAAITHLDDATTFIKAMRQLGVRIALDDFGAGASSFGYLKALPVDFLKIDGQFVKNVLNDKLDHAAVRCFCEVATVCGLKTIAEFVESRDVLAELNSIGVDFAQGYLIHRPEPLQAVLGEPCLHA